MRQNHQNKNDKKSHHNFAVSKNHTQSTDHLTSKHDVDYKLLEC